jgi:23S rRNA (cytidine1920-2'-O)/16S rRNA (cytidine1409-2'-O)-methyltransferase
MLAWHVSERRRRLDQLLVDRGLAPSRTRAQALVMAGVVSVDGVVVDKAGKSVEPGAVVVVAKAEHPWVSRGGMKLAAALAAFGVSATGKRCLDVGASTGGFTHVLLENDSASVVALDVGHGQLDWRLRNEPRVEVREGVNARHLRPDDFAGRFDLITVDVSFISLRLVLPALVPLLEDAGDLIALVKPQFAALGLECLGRLSSPVAGPAGNVEELVRLRRRPPPV